MKRVICPIEKDKEENNCLSSVDRISLVHKHDKAGNNVTLKTTRTLWKTQVCE